MDKHYYGYVQGGITLQCFNQPAQEVCLAHLHFRSCSLHVKFHPDQKEMWNYFPAQTCKIICRQKTANGGLRDRAIPIYPNSHFVCEV